MTEDQRKERYYWLVGEGVHSCKAAELAFGDREVKNESVEEITSGDLNKGQGWLAVIILIGFFITWILLAVGTK